MGEPGSIMGFLHGRGELLFNFITVSGSKEEL
jgi:hypothetical protein